MSLPADLAATHAHAMKSRPWDAAEFATLLASPGVFLIGNPTCFALGRVAADEAELLTLATDPAHRRQGLARAALAAFDAAAIAHDATTAFLEVAADNTSAINLYASAGWVGVGRRKGYYAGPEKSVDAIVMRRELTHGQGPLPR